jgi:hypothetical protein
MIARVSAEIASEGNDHAGLSRTAAANVELASPKYELQQTAHFGANNCNIAPAALMLAIDHRQG